MGVLGAGQNVIHAYEKEAGKVLSRGHLAVGFISFALLFLGWLESFTVE